MNVSVVDAAPVAAAVAAAQLQISNENKTHTKRSPRREEGGR